MGKKLKPKTMINYTDANGKKVLSILVVDKKGKFTRKFPESNKALTELKKFVNAL